MEKVTHHQQVSHETYAFFPSPYSSWLVGNPTMSDHNLQ